MYAKEARALLLETVDTYKKALTDKVKYFIETNTFKSIKEACYQGINNTYLNISHEDQDFINEFIDQMSSLGYKTEIDINGVRIEIEW